MNKRPKPNHLTKTIPPILALACISPVFGSMGMSSTNETVLMQAPQQQKRTAQSDTDKYRILYNNENLAVDLGVGLWGIPMPIDYDGDGLTDLVISCPDTPYKGIYYFKNIGTPQKPFFDRPQKLSARAANNIKLSIVDGKPRVLMHGFEYEGFFKDFFKNKRPIPYEGPVMDEGFKRSRSKMWSYVDWDGDGDQDIIAGVDTWDDYGWDNAFNEQGEWIRGPLHGYVHLLENVNGKYVNRGRIRADGREIDTYGAPNPNVYDWDGDGDLDIICGEFVDGLTWFENIGTRTVPRFTKGRQLANAKGEIRFHIEMIVPVMCDLDRDGHMDLLVGDEDGRVAWVRHTGEVKRRMPQFESPVYLRQKADAVKFGALSTPCAYDWDGNGKQDIITGNSAGNIALIRNLSGGENPVWDAPQLFTVDGKPIRIMAGENGSIQGPAERKWGYTVLTIADWDGDGRADLIVNSIWGKIEWFRNIGKGLELAPAQPVRVAWEGNTPKPVWNWWNPEPGTLVTQWRTTPVAIDWNKDGLTDLIMLDHEGYLCFWERFKDKNGELLLKPGRRIFLCDENSSYNNKSEVTDTAAGPLRLNSAEAGASGRRKICITDWDGDGDLDILVNSRNTEWFENLGTTKDGMVQLRHRGNVSSVRLAGHTTCPTPVDWDGNGVPDLLVGAEDGHFYLLKNNIRQIK